MRSGSVPDTTKLCGVYFSLVRASFITTDTNQLLPTLTVYRGATLNATQASGWQVSTSEPSDGIPLWYDCLLQRVGRCGSCES
jgi:hypothetical protein